MATELLKCSFSRALEALRRLAMQSLILSTFIGARPATSIASSRISPGICLPIERLVKYYGRDLHPHPGPTPSAAVSR